MNIKRTTSMIFAALIMFLPGCNFPGVPNANPQSVPQARLQAWVDAPLNGARLPQNVPYPVVCHGADPGEIAAVEFRVNGSEAQSYSAPEKGQRLLTAGFNWLPVVPGRTVLECKAQNASGVWSEPAQAIVMVDEAAVPTAAPDLTVTPVLTPTPTPESTLNRCALFDSQTMSLAPMNIPPGEPIKFSLYVRNTAGWPGVEVEVPGDPGPWEYSGLLGDIQAEGQFYQEYPGRLYFVFVLTPQMLDTWQALQVFVSGCDAPIASFPRVSVVASKEPTTVPRPTAAPAPTLVPTPTRKCSSDLDRATCQAAGGKFRCEGASCTCICRGSP